MPLVSAHGSDALTVLVLGYRQRRAGRVFGQSMNVRCADLDRDDDALLRALREGDERVFSDLVDRWSHMMLRLALSRVESHAVAEEVVQDSWQSV
jgi:hypothetical protein